MSRMTQQLSVLFLVLCLGLTAAGAAAQGTPVASPTAGDPIRIGVLNPTTGSFAAFGEQVNTGMQLYFDSIGNAVDGVSIELVFADTAGDPQQALEQARRLVGEEGVSLLMGIVNSAEVPPMAQFAAENQIPLILTIGGARMATGPERSPYVFRTAMANGQQDAPLGWYTATTLGKTRAATFAWDFIVGEERVTGFADTFTAAGGEIVTQQKPPLGTTDYGPFISQVDPSSIDVVYSFFAGPGAIAFAQQAREFGLTPNVQLVAPDYFTSGVLGEMGGDAEGLVQAGAYAPSIDSPENAAFLALFAAEVGGEPGVYQEEGFLGAMVAAAALDAVNADLTDEDAFLVALGKVQVFGPSGAFRFDAQGQSVRPVYITQVEAAEGGAYTQTVLEVIPGVGQDWVPPAA